MKFKQLEIKPEGNWLQRLFYSKKIRKTVLYSLAGALIGFVYFYISEGKNISNLSFNDAFESIITGGFIGFFITNSPCSRGKC